jgi:glucans biosynthesis protein C
MYMVTSRRYDLDWLRVIAIFLLMFYHTGMIFVANWGWHIKDETTSHLFAEWMFFMNRWRMVLLFFISGAGSWYALGLRTGGGYLKRKKPPFVISSYSWNADNCAATDLYRTALEWHGI